MSEMVERVARAIALAELDDETRAIVDPKTWPVADSYCDIARAAIEAMREPTDEIWEAGATNLYGVSREKAIEYAKEDKYESDGRKADEIWRAMIDAALK